MIDFHPGISIGRVVTRFFAICFDSDRDTAMTFMKYQDRREKQAQSKFDLVIFLIWESRFYYFTISVFDIEQINS